MGSYMKNGLRCIMDEGGHDTRLAVAGLSFLNGGGSPVKVYTTLRARGGSATNTRPGLWGRQWQLLGCGNDQHSREIARAWKGSHQSQ